MKSNIQIYDTTENKNNIALIYNVNSSKEIFISKIQKEQYV
jgi:hypothetical protein